MVALSALIGCNWRLISFVGLVIIFGHNLLDPVRFAPDSVFYIPWAILHERSWIEVGGLSIRTSYPVLPWLGVIAVGFVFGWLFTDTYTARERQKLMTGAGVICLLLFCLLRLLNVYGEKPWIAGDTAMQTWMSFFNVTKYPPSLLFVLLTLGAGLLVFAFFERCRLSRPVYWLSVFGSVPMFFYILHLYVMKLCYVICLAVWGPITASISALIRWRSYGLQQRCWLCFSISRCGLFHASNSAGGISNG